MGIAKIFTSKEREELVKLLNETSRQQLSGMERSELIERANKLLQATGMTWERLLVPVNVAGEAVAWLRSQNVQEVFETILGHLEDDGPRNFIKSLEGQFVRKGTLSEAQCSALRKFYDNITNGGEDGAYHEGDEWWEDDGDAIDGCPNGMF